MGSRASLRTRWGPAILIVEILLTLSQAMAETCEKWVAKAVSVQGRVQALRLGEKQWTPVKFQDTFCPGDRVRVLTRSRADILLADETTLRLDQNTTVTFPPPDPEKTPLLELLNGAIHFFSHRRRNIRIVTPFVNATVEGTEFYIEVQADQTSLSLFEGRIVAANQTGEIRLAEGQSALARRDQAPVLQIVVRPWDAIQWTLYYPSVLDFHPSSFKIGSSTDWQTLARQSAQWYREGDLEKALEILSEIGEGITDPAFFVHRASLLLAVGRADDARGDIERTLQLSPMDSRALSLQSIIAVAQNERERAFELASKAVEVDPRSASARIALSYALQARFDLSGALECLKESVKIEPDNALAWARLSEIYLSFGDLKEALKSAETSASLNPDLSRTQTVLGFAFLDQVKTKKSKEAFEKAISLDQADPLPRLGLGLTKIREGKLSEGRAEIEIAASLGPNQSLIRSYLGKAYYEEKRDRLAGEQYAVAKGLDPSDPTPFFYDAIRKQTENQPVEALRDMETSISLNDNRAVYRSRLLLDEDLAARSASLARIYSDLGFQPLALVEGWKSLNTDPTNFSAHRFLSDSYSALPRHEIARVSELLQSQLLQPINITPLQPHLAQANLFLLAGAGPSTPSFNEFNPLFNRDRVTLQMSGVGGENNTVADEAILAGVWGRVSYSVGQFHYQTDGFRKNNDLTDNIYNAFLQVSLTPQTSVQGEAWAKNTQFGDLALRFDPNDILWNRQREQTKAMRLGFRHGFAPGSDLIGSFIFQDVDYDNQTVNIGVLDIDGKETSFSGELQYLFRSRMLNLIAGAGYFDVDRKENWTFITPAPSPAPFPLLQVNARIHHVNLYLYAYINYLKNVTLTLGASGDFFSGGVVDHNQLNPKLGLTWNPFASTTLRGALFRTFRRTLINNQTVEPTQVAGFNQFFDDDNSEGADAWCAGVALDQKLSRDLFAGAGLSGRNLQVPWREIQGAITLVHRADWEERLARVYLYWTPHPWFALSAEYQYERIDREKDQVGSGVAYARTQRVPVGISFYHPSGLSALFKATYFDQSGRFQHAYPDPNRPFFVGEDSFWVLDAAVSYRLPKRYGFLTFGIKNLLDKTFRYFDTDIKNPQVQPGRFIYGKVTLAF